MSVRLFMQPQTFPMSWERFCQSSGPFSIALDGYVNVGPRFQPEGPRANFNHHEEVDRLATRATCAQILIAIRQGLFLSFRGADNRRADVYVNDCDEDVCISWFLLTHAELVEKMRNPALSRMVNVEDKLDATAGAYPYPCDMPVLSELAWVFEPYRRFRLSGEIDRKDMDAYVGIVREVEDRIGAHIRGRGRKVDLDTRFDRIREGRGWTMIRDVGAQARMGAHAEGIRAYVAVRERPDGRWTYTVARMSIFVPFDIPAIIDALNREEGDVPDRWGGGSTIGGSPRVMGSRLSPDDVVRIIGGIVG